MFYFIYGRFTKEWQSQPKLVWLEFPDRKSLYQGVIDHGLHAYAGKTLVVGPDGVEEWGFDPHEELEKIAQQEARAKMEAVNV